MAKKTTLGMSDPEIEARKEKILARQRRRIGEDRVVYFWEQTPKEIHELRELCCRSMINTCLTYGSLVASFYDGTRLMDTGARYLRELQCDKCTPEQCKAYALSAKRIVELVDEQQSRFRSSAKVHYGVHTDYEGCSYNAVEWR